MRLLGPIYAHIIKIMEFWSKNFIFIKYSVGHWGYKHLDVSISKIFVSRHIIIDESFFPYKPQHSNIPSHENPVILPTNLNLSLASFTLAGSNFDLVAAPHP